MLRNRHVLSRAAEGPSEVPLARASPGPHQDAAQRKHLPAPMSWGALCFLRSCSKLCSRQASFKPLLEMRALARILPVVAEGKDHSFQLNGHHGWSSGHWGCGIWGSEASMGPDSGPGQWSALLRGPAQIK